MGRDQYGITVTPAGSGRPAVVDPAARSFPLPSSPSDVGQILGRPGEVWGAESAADSSVVVRGA